MKPTQRYTPGVGWHEPGDEWVCRLEYEMVSPLHHVHCNCGSCRCMRPSTHKRGGGYVEVECYCEEHAMAAAKKYGDTTVPRQLTTGDGCLLTPRGEMNDRSRCQWRMQPASQPPRTAS